MNKTGFASHQNLALSGIVGVLLYALGGVQTGLGQAPPDSVPPAVQTNKAEQQVQAPSLRTNIDEVALDIVVHDKSKKPILDLKPQNLIVTDNDTPVKLTGLRLVHGDSVRRHTVTMVFDPFIGPTAKNARIAAQKILKTLPEKGYSFAVLDLRGRLRLVQPFTEDRTVINHAVEVVTESDPVRLESTRSLEVNIVTDKADPERTKVVTEAEKNLIRIAQTGTDISGRHIEVTQRVYYKALFSALQESQRVMQEKHGYMNLGSLSAVIHSQQKLGDRKALIYFTHNMTMDSAAKEALKAVIADATRAGIAVYIVDMDAINQARGYQLDNAHLNAKPAFNPGRVATSAYSSVQTVQQDDFTGIHGTPSAQGEVWGTAQDVQMMTDFHRMGPVFAPFEDVKSPMAKLAEDTGGIYIDAQSNLKKPLQQMAEDLETYYEATYIPPFKEYDGSFRAIQVKPTRSGLRVQSKTGYFAVAPGAEAGIRPFEVPLLKTLDEPSLPSDLKFRMAVLRFGELTSGNTNTLALEIPYSELQVKEDVHTNLFSAHVALVAQVKDAEGGVVEHFSDDITKRGALETLDRDHGAALSFERHFVAMPGMYTVEVAVNDQFSGKTSAQRMNFEIPDTGKAPALSDMVLVRKMNTVREEDDDTLNPLRYEHDQITPDLSAQLPLKTKGLSIFFMLHPDPNAKDTATLQMEVSRDGNPGRRTPLPFTPNQAQGASPYLASFGNTVLAPGHYEVKAYLSQSGKTAVQTIAFNVGDGQSAGTTELSDGAAKPVNDAAIATLAATQPVTVPGQLAITASTKVASTLSKPEAQQLVEDARTRATSYTESLPNFLCLQVTNRSLDPSAMGRWKLKDTMVEVLRYRDKHETRTMIEINGQKATADRDSFQGPMSEGEFGGVLKAVFSTSSKADFQWKETAELDGGPVQVFDYTVEKAHSMFGVVGTDGREIIVGFHGQVFIESATRSVRRISLIADLPKDFKTRASSISVDYGYVSINDHDYLLPVAAEMRLIKGKHFAVLNTIEFRNYKRFGSNLRILGFKPVDDPQKP